MVSESLIFDKKLQKNKKKFADVNFIRTFAIPFVGKRIGELAEWSNAAVLKTVDLNGSGGSNPSLSATKGVNQVVTRFTPFFTPKNRGWVHFLNF